MDLNETFARHLKATRKRQNITQGHVADVLGVSRQAVSRWENGDGYPEVEKLVLLARELGVSLDSLFALPAAPHTDGSELEATTAEVQAEPSGGAEASASSTQYVRVLQPSERIAIESQDGEKLCLCYDVRATRSFGTGEIKYALLAVTEKGFWNRKEEIIGWYTDLDVAKREIKAVYAAMAAGHTSYDLQYFTPIEMKGRFGAPRIAEETQEA
ncbi:helix-turn-helix transcriptional regulator [Trueperella pyogenes]